MRSDINTNAFRIVKSLTTEKPKVSTRSKISKGGGLRGGPARARALSPERRREIAIKASRTRWLKEKGRRSLGKQNH